MFPQLNAINTCRHKENQPVVKLGMLYHVYPRVFSDFIAQFMKKNVPGYKDLQAADDRWKDYFNELRKRVRKQRMVKPRKHRKSPDI